MLSRSKSVPGTKSEMSDGKAPVWLFAHSSMEEVSVCVLSHEDELGFKGRTMSYV